MEEYAKLTALTYHQAKIAAAIYVTIHMIPLCPMCGLNTQWHDLLLCQNIGTTFMVNDTVIKAEQKQAHSERQFNYAQP